MSIFNNHSTKIRFVVARENVNRNLCIRLKDLSSRCNNRRSSQGLKYWAQGRPRRRQGLESCPNGVRVQNIRKKTEGPIEPMFRANDTIRWKSKEPWWCWLKVLRWWIRQILRNLQLSQSGQLIIQVNSSRWWDKRRLDLRDLKIPKITLWCSILVNSRQILGGREIIIRIWCPMRKKTTWHNNIILGDKVDRRSDI